MIGKIYKELLIIVFVFIVGWLGFSYLKLEPSSPELEISIEDEEKLAEILTESITSDMDEISTPYLDSAIFEITKRLEGGIENSPYEYTFHVIQSEEINAFATLGGHIFIYSELIKVTENPEELAAILAHEIGHVEKRHVINRMVTEVGLTLLFSVLSGNDPVLISEILEMSVSNVFTRSQEKEADNYGLELMEKCEISPLYMAHAFRKLKDQTQSNMVPEILSTHPNINSRIRGAVGFEVKEGFTATPFHLDWNRVKAELGHD